jgi:hypothetical protein
MTTLAISRVARPARQLTKLVGAVAASIVIGYGLYRMLLDLGTPFVLAAAVAFAGGAVTGYALGRRASLGVVLGGLAASAFLVWVLDQGIGLSPVAAYLAAVPAVTAATFLARLR